MSKNYLNVWTWDFPKRYYLTHPWRWFKELYWNLKHAKDRITKGYTYTDWVNFDTWFVKIASDMLRDMALHGYGYPGSEPFETPEKWKSWLHRMADQLAYLSDEDNGNEYAEPYMNQLMKSPHKTLFEDETPEEIEMRNRYLERSKEVYEEHKQLFRATMKELLEHWGCLWD